LHLRLSLLAIGAPSPETAASAIAAWRESPANEPVHLSPDRQSDVFSHAVLPALKHFAQARRLCPLLPRPHMRFAAHANELVRADPPDKYWERALTLAPYDADVWYFAGVQLLHEGKADEAWKDWRKSLELTPGPKYDWQRAKLQDRLTAIVAATAQAAGADPRRRAELLLSHILPDRSDDLLAAAKLLDPTLAPTGASRPLLDRALALLADRPEGLTPEESMLKAQVHEALGQDDDAVRAYKHALTFAGAKPEWRFQLVKLLIAKARWKEAQTELATLQRQMPDNPQVKDWIAEVDRELLIQ
jgi:tetratricopeptide (TPR) repeat protein